MALIKTRDVIIYTRQKLKEYYKKTYRDHANIPISPRLYWKEYEREFLVLSRLVRDLLLVPTTGAKKPLESESQEALEEDKVLKAIEEDTEPISDNKEIEESKNLKEEESIEEDVVDYDEADLLPPPIIQLSNRSQKRSSGRVTMPSSRLRGYEVY
ncbi:hypothetical protein N7501_007591 [Penicillium viridicatum]|nr:hypothetical protein N7501_007591 [Penicillium viridicatum]